MPSSAEDLGWPDLGDWHEPSASALKLHFQHVVAEAHRDCYEQIHHANAGDTNPLRNRLVPRLRAGGVNLSIYAIGGDSLAHSDSTERPLLATITNIDNFTRYLSDPDSGARAVLESKDVPSVADETVSFLLHIEGAKPLEGRLSTLRALHRLGLRSIQLTWNHRNELADGVMEERSGGGLTEFGAAVVEEVGRLGMLLDVAHLAATGFWQTLELANGPVVVTHANSRSLFEHPRNITDEQALAIAQTGGFVGVQATPRVVADEPSIQRLVDHIDHFSGLIGIDHVALGLDFSANDGPRPTRERLFPGKRGHLPGLADAEDLPRLTEAMLRRGYSEENIVKVLGHNLCRVVRQALRGDSPTELASSIEGSSPTPPIVTSAVQAGVSNNDN